MPVPLVCLERIDIFMNDEVKCVIKLVFSMLVLALTACAHADTEIYDIGYCDISLPDEYQEGKYKNDDELVILPSKDSISKRATQNIPYLPVILVNFKVDALDTLINEIVSLDNNATIRRSRVGSVNLDLLAIDVFFAGEGLKIFAFGNNEFYLKFFVDPDQKSDLYFRIMEEAYSMCSDTLRTVARTHLRTLD